MNLHRLDLVSLSLFTLVVRTGSISKGAALAHLAVGAASKRISDLELAVGIPLLERHSRGATPTAAGGLRRDPDASAGARLTRLRRRRFRAAVARP